MSNQANEKLRSANRELRRSNCRCQYPNFTRLFLKSTHDEIMKKCHNGKCVFKQYEDILGKLAIDYQSKLKKNGINISEKERIRCMLSSNQPSKIIEEYLFTHFTIQLDDQQVTTISDSGCNSSAIVKNTVYGERGPRIIEKGINNKTDEHNSVIHDIVREEKGILKKQKITSMEVDSIISDDQYLDYSNSVDLMIEEMKEACASKGLVFDISKPKFLIGHNILDPTLIFVSSFGMKLYEINTPLNEQRNYAISGFTINGCKEYSQPRLILEIEDEQETKSPKGKQETQQTPTYCHMIKSYANALKGDNHDKKEITKND